MPLVYSRLVNGKPLYSLIIPVSVAGKDITCHSSNQRIKMLVHKIVILMLEGFDDRSNQVCRKISRIFIRPRNPAV